MVSAADDPELYMILAINDARFLFNEKGASAGMQCLAAEVQRIESTSPVVRMAALWRLGTLCRGVGHLADAFNHISAARTIADSSRWDYDVALLTAELGSVYVETGDPVKAIAHLEEAYRALNYLGDTQYADVILMNLALAHGRVGETSTAESLMEEAVNRQRVHAPFDRIVNGLLNLASMKKRLGKIDEASAIYEEVLDQTETDRLSTARVRALIGVGSICNVNGDHHAALGNLDRARTLATELGQTVMALDIDAKRADVHRDLGNTQLAVDLLRKTFAELSTHTYTHYTIDSGSLLERWLVEDGHHAEAYAVLKICSDLQREVYRKESERALQISSVRQNMEAERRDLSLREEERRILLHQVLPLPIADRIMAGERRIADQIDMVGILFADIVGFTQSSAGKSPSAVLEQLEELFQAVDKVVTSHGCEKIKSIGDSYMATTGTSAEQTAKDPAEAIARLARCGLDMLDLLRDAQHSHVQLRIGMHAGPVVAGVMGGMRLAYDMWGDTVNVASRMESTSAPGRFQTTSVVADLLRSMPEFKITPRDAINVKGRGAMETFWVERGDARSLTL
jgi:class 3 adenylate cyclase